MKKKNKILNKKREIETIAITQILILIIATIAFSWMVGSTVKVVSADSSTSTSNENTPSTSACYSQNFCVNGATYPGHLVGNSCVANTAVLGVSCPSGQCANVNTCLGTVSNSGGSGGGTNTLKAIGDLVKPVGTTVGSALALKALGLSGGTASNAANLGNTIVATNTAATGASGTGSAAAGSGATTLGTILSTASSSFFGVAGMAVVWAGLAFLVGRYILGPVFGLNTQQSQALGYSAAIGAATGYIVSIMITTSAAGPIGAAVGAVVAFVMFAILYKKSSVDMIMYNCYQWEAPSGRGMTPTQMTDRCKICNSQRDLPCTDYQCRSLGQGCVLINDASSGNQLCIWNNTRDILPPVIKPWKEALYPPSSTLKNFSYTPDNTISPPDKGVKITYTGTQQVSMDGTTRCAPPFTPISFGVQLDEPAKCKISPDNNASSYAEMADIFMGRGIRDYNQSFTLSLPSAEAMAADNITADNGGKYELYVRCEDANGNVNIANFVFKFCISQGPDITPPAIIGTSILNNTPIAYNQSNMPIELYVTDQTFTKANASCRWSRLDKNYNVMENNLSCTHSLLDMNSQLAYTCRGNLTGLKDGQSNKFYFRCIDDLGNANTQSYPLTLLGTAPIKIDSVGPTGILRGPSETVNVNLTAETSGGYKDGNAICAFSETGTPGSYVDFFYGYDVEPFSTNIHSQELGLAAGNYTYFIKCRDQGGNADEKNVTFRVEVDTSPPIVVRVYKDEESNTLKIITDETADCVYSNTNCDYIFDQGTPIDSSDQIEHNIDWDISKDFYIKCKDQYGQIPPEKECSIIARPFEIFQLQ